VPVESKRVSERVQTESGAGGDADNVINDDEPQAASGQNLILRLHDRANVQQTSSKHRAGSSS